MVTLQFDLCIYLLIVILGQRIYRVNICGRVINCDKLTKHFFPASASNEVADLINAPVLTHLWGDFFRTYAHAGVGLDGRHVGMCMKVTFD